MERPSNPMTDKVKDPKLPSPPKDADVELEDIGTEDEGSEK
jgi:hypothetical protein